MHDRQTENERLGDLAVVDTLEQSARRGARKIVVLGMFDLSRLDGARPIRIHNLHTTLKAHAPTTLLSGNRMPRRLAVIRYVLQGGLRQTRAVYVEASTSTATEIDLLFLVLAAVFGVPMVVYIPDAYQLFPELFPRVGWRVKLLDWGWRLSIAAYQRLADLLLFPSSGLATCFRNRRRIDLLPPAGQPGREWTPPPGQPPVVVYTGGASFADGSDLLLTAMERVVDRYPDARCYFISVNNEFIEGHPVRHAGWLTVESRTAEELPALMRSATLVVIPRRINSYNDLAMPVKLFDYMSFGRPLVVTACRDMAAFVNEVEAGLVVKDTAEELAQGILRLIDDPDLAARLGRNGYRAIQTNHSWSQRAKRLVQMIEEIEGA